MTPVQLDLFGEVESALHAQEAKVAADGQWTEGFTRTEVVIDVELTGFAKGSTHLAWTCPGCGELELTPYSLWINHGFDPTCEQSSRRFEQNCHRRTEIGIDKPFHRTTDRTDTDR